MEELVSAAGAIQAAQIQANYALWAALLSSFIGASGLVYAAWYAFKSGLKTQVKNHLLESRREVYLDFITKSNALIHSGSLIEIRPDSFYEELHEISLAFETSIHKVLLISETQNQQEIYKCFEVFNICFKSYIDAVNRFRVIEFNQAEMGSIYYRLESELANSEQEAPKRLKLLEDIKVLRKFIEDKNINEVDLEKCNKDLFYELKKEHTKIVILLRSELGISTDINLETKLSREFFKEATE